MEAEHTRDVRVNALARVEGEGGLRITVRDGHVVDAVLDIYEPPRFFEALLRGRGYAEPVDITARICGICPVAYQMSAVLALEDIAGVRVGGQLAALRRLLYCGEWIESHALHIHLLHAPDFLGYPSGVAMAGEHRSAVERGLRIKKAGNSIVALIGGREVHPVNVRVGGFHRVLRKRELEPLHEELLRARDDALSVVRWVAGLDFPDHDRDYEFVAVDAEGVYPMMGHRVLSSRGLDIPVSAYDDHFVETQVRHSSALHSHRSDGSAYLVGPLARYALHHDLLTPLARVAAQAAGLGDVVRNPFRSIVVRAVETLHACDEAVRIIEAYEEPDAPSVPYEMRAGIGYGATEAPRGLLYHRYTVDASGSIADARIVPPTSQNQAMIEADLRDFVDNHLDLEQQELGLRCEQMIRNYDPCISCATHFLRFELERS
jgi:sulfhydrogenase subunit alpha